MARIERTTTCSIVNPSNVLLLASSKYCLTGKTTSAAAAEVDTARASYSMAENRTVYVRPRIDVRGTKPVDIVAACARISAFIEEVEPPPPPPPAHTTSTPRVFVVRLESMHTPMQTTLTETVVWP